MEWKSDHELHYDCLPIYIEECQNSHFVPDLISADLLVNRVVQTLSYPVRFCVNDVRILSKGTIRRQLAHRRSSVFGRARGAIKSTLMSAHVA